MQHLSIMRVQIIKERPLGAAFDKRYPCHIHTMVAPLVAFSTASFSQGLIFNTSLFAFAGNIKTNFRYI